MLKINRIKLELQKIIKELLVKNNFVSLPGLGSFVQSYQHAKLSPDGKKFLPPSEEVSFDPNRTFNDEVLEQYTQSKLGLSRDDSIDAVKEFVNSVKETISKGNNVFFDSIGTLKKDSAGRIILEEAQDMEKISSTFGLQAVDVSDSTKQQISKNKTQDIPLVKSKPKSAPGTETSHKGWIIGVASAVAVMALLTTGLLYFIPDMQFWRETKNQTIAETSSFAYEKDTSSTIAEPDDKTEVSDSLEQEQIALNTEEVAFETDKKKALYYQEPRQQDDKTFYIISGSFESLENAQTHFNKLANNGHNPEIIQSDGRYRVAMSKFTDRNRALSELYRLRREKPTESVWLLGL